MTRKGRLVVTATFHVPVNVEHYKSAYNKDIPDITRKEIIQVEVDNFAANPEAYQEMLSAHLEDLTFNYEEEEVDDRSLAGGE